MCFNDTNYIFFFIFCSLYLMLINSEKALLGNMFRSERIKCLLFFFLTINDF